MREFQVFEHEMNSLILEVSKPIRHETFTDTKSRTPVHNSSSSIRCQQIGKRKNPTKAKMVITDRKDLLFISLRWSNFQIVELDEIVWPDACRGKTKGEVVVVYSLVTQESYPQLVE